MPAHFYAVDLCAGATDEFLVTYRGAQIGVAADLDEAARLAAADAAGGYPFVEMDLLGAAAGRLGLALSEETVATDRFRRELAGLIAEGWEVRFAAPRP